MSYTQRARRCLKGRRTAAVTVECINMAAGLLIPLMSLGALRLFNLNAERVVRASELLGDGGIYAVITALLIITDWLLISPIMLGRLAFYRNVATGKRVSVGTVFGFFGRHYAFALRWRLFCSMYRLLYISVCLLPAAITVGLTRAVGLSRIHSPFIDIIMLFGTVFGIIFFVFGLLVYKMAMIRKMPAAYLLLDKDRYPRRLFRDSSRYMRGHVIETFQITAGFAGWFASCLLFFPRFYVLPLFLTVRAAVINDIIEAKVQNNNLADTIQINADYPLKC